MGGRPRNHCPFTGRGKRFSPFTIGSRQVLGYVFGGQAGDLLRSVKRPGIKLTFHI